MIKNAGMGGNTWRYWMKWVVVIRGGGRQGGWKWHDNAGKTKYQLLFLPFPQTWEESESLMNIYYLMKPKSRGQAVEINSRPSVIPWISNHVLEWRQRESFQYQHYEIGRIRKITSHRKPTPWSNMSYGTRKITLIISWVRIMELIKKTPDTHLCI